MALLIGSAMRAAAADAPAAAPPQRQEELIKVLQSDAPKPQKALACKYLAIYGGKEAVPALAALLSDQELAAWARIGLEAIPDSSVDDALRDAMDKLQGRLLVGVINSISVRRDAKAIDGLAAKLTDKDETVSSCAAAALGHIGGDRAAQVLEPQLTAAAPAVRAAAAEGCVLCAERYLNEGNDARAIALYDAVRKAQVPRQRVLEGIRGAILARHSAGIPLLVEQLKSSDKAIMGIGLRTARELRGDDVTDALIAELGRADAERQALLILALADRNDPPRVRPVVLEAARSGAPGVRVAAAGVLDRLGDVSCVPVLVEAAASDDADLVQAAKTSLARLPGKDVDASLLARLNDSSGKARQVLIELAEQRKLDQAMPIFLKSAEDADAGARNAALTAIGAIGDDKQVPDLVKLLPQAKDANDRRAIEQAVASIGGRWGAACVPHLVPLAKGEGGVSADTRIAAIHALVPCGGPDALASVVAATSDADPAVQDEAVRTLSTWPNRWPTDAAAAQPLLALARSAQKPAHRVLAVRGYLQYVQGDKKLSPQQRLADVDAILPQITRPDEKRLVIATLFGMASAGALDRLTTLASADPAVTEEACSAIVRLAGRNNIGASNELRRKALQTVVEKSKSEATRNKAQEILKGIR
jgi:HEAT repeat protein